MIISSQSLGFSNNAPFTFDVYGTVVTFFPLPGFEDSAHSSLMIAHCLV